MHAHSHRYFKKWPVPELDILQLPLNPNALTWSHANNTLVVSYAKPPEVVRAVSGSS